MSGLTVKNHLLLAALLLLRMADAGTTTMTTARGRYQDDDWNVPTNWDQGVPTGDDDAIIADGLSATVDGLYDGAGTVIPQLTGTLTIGQGAHLRLESTNAFNAVEFVSVIRLQQGAILGTNVKYTLDLPLIEITSSAEFRCLSTGAHWRTTNFHGISGGIFTVTGINGATINFNSATTITGLILPRSSRHKVYGKAPGCFGTGDVKVEATIGGQGAQLYLEVSDTIDDGATLELRGNGYDSATQDRLTISSGVVEQIGNLIVDGEPMAHGTYTKADGFISGDGTLIVGTTATTTIAATTSTTVSFHCQGQCYAAWSTPWETKCMFVQDAWDGSRPDHPCRGCPECETELCQSECHSSFNLPWDTKCSYEADPWDSNRLKYPCRGCSECDTAMCQPQCRWSSHTAWDTKCSYAADPWDASRPEYPCRGCVECDTAMCQHQCYAAWSTPWETKCTRAPDVWDGSRPNHACNGCPECLALQSEPFKLTIKVHPIRVDQVLDEGIHTKVCLSLATKAQTLSSDPAGVVITSDGTLECTDPSRCRGFGYEGKAKQGKRVLTMKGCNETNDFFYFETKSHWPSRLRLQGDGRCVQAIRVSYSINLLILEECYDDAKGQLFFFLQDKQVWGTVPGERVPIEDIELQGPGPDGASDVEWAEIFRRYSGNQITTNEAGRLATVKFYEEGKHANACVAWRSPKGANYPQMLFAASSCDEHWDNVNSWGRRYYLAPEGECRSNDAQCAGAPRSNCSSLQSEGADCWWDVPNYSGVCSGRDSRCDGSSRAVCEYLIGTGAGCTWEDTVAGPLSNASRVSEAGECIGNDSRCEGSSQGQCELLAMQGADCRWFETPSPTPSVSTSSAPSPTPMEPGECVGNDSRCAGSSQAKCISLESEGADCGWQIDASTTTNPSGPGECVGNDSRCRGSSQQTCALLGSQSADCIWEITEDVEGGCKGNDSRCAGSSHAKCSRIGAEGADCIWKVSDPSPGTCSGYDTRCEGADKQDCNGLTQQGSNCSWRDDYTVVGTLDVNVSGADGDVSDGVCTGISELTGIPQENADCDTIATERRRLHGRRLAAQLQSVRYALVVDSSVPATVVYDSNKIGEILDESNSDNLNRAIESGLQATYFGSEDLRVTVASISVANVSIVNQATSTSTSVVSATSQIATSTDKPVSIDMVTSASQIATSTVMATTTISTPATATSAGSIAGGTTSEYFESYVSGTISTVVFNSFLAVVAYVTVLL